MIHDEKINIAIGRSAHSKSWKNKKMLWSDFAARIAEPYHTNETYKEFVAMTKAEQGVVKDVGGYVGGYLRHGRRNPQNVVHRQILTLDLDFAHLDFWDDFTLQFENAALLHATHKHCEASPRYRLIMPLNREVTPDEYKAISRQVAGMIDIDLFDQTTFETNRLMFWPSTPKDVEYYFRDQDGPWLDADEILDSYIDWKDISLWPTAGREVDGLVGAIKKLDDPKEKHGIVGAFCRTYSITEAIAEFLSDQYTETVIEDRYTYTGGSTSSGLIVYDDTWAYSHHGTDPAGGRNSNAFDLVRLHLFGHKDDDPTISGSKAVSYKAMEDFARKDKRVKKLLGSEIVDNAKYIFAENYLDEEDDEPMQIEGESEDTEWLEDLEVDAKSNYKSSAFNIDTILQHDARLRECFKQNIFDNKRYVFRNLPWRRVKNPEPIKNVDYAGVRNYLETVYGIAGNYKIEDSMSLVFEKNSFHPIRDYLNGLEWDGTQRIKHLFIDYFGAEDNIYTQEVAIKFLVGAVARVFRPGVKFDLMPVIIGPQGTKKSSFFNKLGGIWYSDTFISIHGRESFEQLQGAWIMEVAELAGFRKADTEPIKHYISKQKDTFRPAYGRAPEDFLRQVVFGGTSNKYAFINDPTGGRRFAPIDVIIDNIIKDVWRDLDKERDQLWAEAKHLFDNGEPLFFSREAEEIALVEQSNHSEIDDRTGVILQYLDRRVPADWASLDLMERRMILSDDKQYKKGFQRDYICIAEIWCECLGKNKEDMDRYKTRDINDIMKSLDGWEFKPSTKNFGLYGVQKYYQRKKL